MKILKDGTLITPEGMVHGDLAMDKGTIVSVGTSCKATADDEVIDVAGKLVFSGFIDAHTHLQCWTGMDYTADSFETGTRAAACGGTTTIVDHATQDKGMTLPQALEEWHKRAGGVCTSNYAFHMAIADWNDQAKKDMSTMRESGMTSFKTYFAYDHLRLDDAETLEVLEYVRDMDGVLCVHCENGTLVNELQRRMLAQGITSPEGHVLSRPAACEAEAISRLCYLTELADAHINIVHLSSELGLDAVREARARGVDVSVETCPQYLLLDESRYLEAGFDGAKYVMSHPSLRKPHNVAVLRDALCCKEIDTIATDHCSFNLCGQKDRGKDDFTKIPNGGPGIEHRPVLIMTTFDTFLGSCDFCRLMSENPARVFGMYPRKGALLEGSDADITVWDPSISWTISVKNQHQNVDYTPYEGFEVHGRAAFVFVNGELVAKDGEPTGSKPGVYVAR